MHRPARIAWPAFPFTVAAALALAIGPATLVAMPLTPMPPPRGEPQPATLQQQAGPAGAEAVSTPQDDTERRAFVRWLQGPPGLLLTEQELEVLQALRSIDQARDFIEWFWRRRDPTPGTPINEFKEELYARLAFIEQEFPSGADRPAWKSGAGIIYLMLGPPQDKRIQRRAFFADGELRDLTLWIYALATDRPFVVPLVETDDGLQLAAARSAGFSAAEWESRLETAKKNAVRQPDLPFSGTARPLGDLDVLPVRVQAGPSAGGLRIDLQMPMRDLFAQPLNDTVMFRYSLGSPGLSLGAIAAVLGREEASEWAHHDLHIAIWLPRDSVPAAEALRLLLVEEASGRQVSLSVPVSGAAGQTAGRQAPPDRVAKGVWVGPLADGEGIAVAYLGPCEELHTQTIAWLLPRPAAAAEGHGTTIELLPGSGLVLAEVAAAGAAGGGGGGPQTPGR